MKKQFLLGVVFLSLLVIQSCRYKDGPKFTLRSAKARITNTWRMHHYIDNGTDKTNDFNNVWPNWKLELKSDNNYTISTTSFIPFSESGTWVLNDAKTELNLKKNNSGNNIWIISRLKSKELWAHQTDGNGHLIEYQLIAD